jgi:hypothetical protein
MNPNNRIRAAIAAASAAAIATIAACGGKSQVSDPPPGGVIAIDGEWILGSQVESLANYLLEGTPLAGIDTARAAALEAGLFPRALARRNFPGGVAEARQKAAVAISMLRDKHVFEDVRAQISQALVPKLPVAIHRKIIEPLLGEAVFGKPAGYVTPEPVETSYGCVIARVDLPDPEAGAGQEKVILSTIELFYDPALADASFRIPWARKGMLDANYVFAAPAAYDWMPPFLRARVPDPRGQSGR